MHGGKTPAGKHWHVAQVANQSGSVEKAHRKLGDLARRKAKREARVNAMSPDELQRHREWQATHGPGGKREVARRNREARAVIEGTVPRAAEPTGEAVELQRVIDLLEARRKRREAATNAADVQSGGEWNDER